MTKQPKGSIDDLRQAVNMAAGLSAQLITAALGMITLQGAYVTFAADKKQIGFFFWFFMLAAFLAFIASIFHAGKGTADLYMNGADGNWNPRFAKHRFVRQTLLCFLGITLFIIAVFVARTDKPSDTEALQKELQSVVDGLKIQSVINQRIPSKPQVVQSQSKLEPPDKSGKISETVTNDVEKETE